MVSVEVSSSQLLSSFLDISFSPIYLLELSSWSVKSTVLLSYIYIAIVEQKNFSSKNLWVNINFLWVNFNFSYGLTFL